MQAVFLEQFGGPENLKIKEVKTPLIKEGEVLIKTRAIGINPVDYKTREGHGAAQRLTLPIILGWDVAGEIVEVHQDSKYRVGDAVFGLINFPGEGKTYAEYVAAPEAHIAIKPQNITYEEAAAVPLAAMIAYQTVITAAHIQKGSRVLIQGAAGGVGHIAVQIAKHAGAYVIGTASTEDEQLLLNLGVDQYIDYTRVRFEKVVNNVDMALDCVGGEITARSMGVIKDGGMLISIPTPVDETITKKFPKVKTPWVLVHSDKQDIEYIASMLESEQINVHIQSSLPFDQIADAHKLLEHSHIQGKTVVTI